MFEVPRQGQPATVASAAAPAAPSQQFDLFNILAALWRGRTTILLTTAACLLLALLFLLIAPHRYTASTEILIDPADLRALANEPTPSSQASDTALLLIDSQVRVLSSDDVLRRVVASQGLARDPEFARGPSPLRLLVNRLLGALGHSSESAAAADPSLMALSALRQHMRVTRAERTYVVDVAVTSEEPAKSAQLANAIVEAYLNEQTAVRADAARQISDSLSGRLNELKQSVLAAEERVQQFKVAHNIVDANGQSVNDQQLSDLSNQLAAAHVRTLAAKGRLDEIVALQKSKLDVGAFPAAVQSQTITALRSQYAEIMRLEAQQMTSLGARHPAVIEIQAQADRLKHMIEDEVNRIALAASAEYASAQASEDLLRRSVDALKQTTLVTDAAMVNLRELQRDVQASRAVYEAFLVRARETGAQEHLDTKNIQVISKADVPINRTFPPSNMILALAAIVLGIGAGSGLVLLRESGLMSRLPARLPAQPPARLPAALPVQTPRRSLFGRKRKAALPAGDLTPDDLAPGVPVLATVPAIDAAIDSKAAQEPNARFAAGMRKVYDAVCANHRKRGNPSILIVAADNDNDSAAVALTLAALAAAKQRVLLIDADLQHRTLSAIDADRTEAGLVDVAVGRKVLSDVVVRDRATNINLIPFISPKSRRDRVIEDGDLKAAFAQTQHFDVVIVAALDVTRDPAARFFAGLVDHIVVVTRADEADLGGIDEIIASLGLDARKVRGAVLTGEAA